VKVALLIWCLAVGLGRQAIVREQWGPGLGGAWRRGRFRQAIATETVALEQRPPGGVDGLAGRWFKLCVFLGAWRLTVRVPRQAVWMLIAPSGTCPSLGDLAVVSPSCWTY